MSDVEKIIVIEDDPEYGTVLQEQFKFLGHEAEWVAVPEEAMERIREAHETGKPFTVASVDKMFEVGRRQRTEFPLGERVVREIKDRYPYIATIMITFEPHTAQDILQLRDTYRVDQFMHKGDLKDLAKLKTAIERATDRVSRHISTAEIPYVPQITPSRYPEPDLVKARPLFGVPYASPEPCDVFMLMPFAEAFTHLFDDHIQPMMQSGGLVAKRASANASANESVQEVWALLNACKFVIADCSRQNPDVMYELGIAHTLGKTTILIAQHGETLPFDIQERDVIRYEDTPAGRLDLEQHLKRAIKQLIAQGLISLDDNPST